MSVGRGWVVGHVQEVLGLDRVRRAQEWWKWAGGQDLWLRVLG